MNGKPIQHVQCCMTHVYNIDITYVSCKSELNIQSFTAAGSIWRDQSHQPPVTYHFWLTVLWIHLIISRKETLLKMRGKTFIFELYKCWSQYELISWLFHQTYGRSNNNDTRCSWVTMALALSELFHWFHYMGQTE